MVYQVDIVMSLFLIYSNWQHLNMNLGEDELSISHRIGIDNRKIFPKTTRRELAQRIFSQSSHHDC